jgi:hypothetical protein
LTGRSSGGPGPARLHPPAGLHDSPADRPCTGSAWHRS